MTTTNKILLGILGIAVAGGIVSLAYFFGNTAGENTAQLNDPTPVATVNGEAVTRGELNAQIAQIAQNPQIQVPREGTEEHAQFERLVLDQMINTRLFLKEAEARDLAPSEAEIEAEFARVLGQFESEAAFESQLAAAGLSRADVREDIKEQLTVVAFRAHLKVENNVEATEEEARALYERAVEEQGIEQSFEDIEEVVYAQVENLEIEQLIAALVQELRSEAEVEILI